MTHEVSRYCIPIVCMNYSLADIYNNKHNETHTIQIYFKNNNNQCVLYKNNVNIVGIYYDKKKKNCGIPTSWLFFKMFSDY